jgi:hypothetical protein
VSEPDTTVSPDLRRIVEGWPYEPGKITVRTIVGKDGDEKIQMRLDLGLLQMEKDGRPDGKRPKGHDSLLEHHLAQLREYEEKNETDLGFHLNSNECQALRDEALMYYHRYLSLFVLEDFERVERDTARNRQVLDLCNKYATEEWDRLVLEQYRPYIVMMHARSKAQRSMAAGMLKTALAQVDSGLSNIQEFFEQHGRPDAFDQSSEVQILKALREDITHRMPIGAIERLNRKLKRALSRERYEEAARIRDQIRAIQDNAETDA